MSDFEKKRREAKERSRLSKEKGNNLAKLMTFKKRLASGQGTSHAAIVSKAMPEGKRQKTSIKVSLQSITKCNGTFDFHSGNIAIMGFIVRLSGSCKHGG